MKGYIIRDVKTDGFADYVAAPPGWSWTAEGMKREPSGWRSVGPEWTTKGGRAFRFKSHRAAARVANLFLGSEIVEVDD